MIRKYFITGTDTGIGKTTATVALLQAASSSGARVLGMKPLASGADDDGQNADARLLQKYSSDEWPYSQINPYLLAEPIAPHLAAAHEGRQLVAAEFAEIFSQNFANVDWIFFEGAGGWLLPLNDQETLADAVEQAKIPVILVVGLRLGCLNHALLTAKVLQAAQIKIAGWIGNCIDPEMLVREENIASLKKYLPAPGLGIIPYQTELSQLGKFINLKLLND